MIINDVIKKPVLEAKYLNVENTDRYRAIIRIFYLKYEKLKYWMYQEEVFDELREDKYFSEYTWDQCKQDLKILVDWGNLLALQDTKRASTLEEFANKKFRYQLSETAVEVERMVVRIENLFIESSSLEPTLLERINSSLNKLKDLLEASDESLYAWWKDLNYDFVRLNQNYQDYMRELNSVKAENLMRTKEFLMFKDRLIDYLRLFVKGLQENVGLIELFFKEIDSDSVEQVLNRVYKYELSIPRIEPIVDESVIYENIIGRFESLRDWFLTQDGRESEVVKVFDTTNEIIRKITAYAARISESVGSTSNRKEEYKKLAGIFYECEDIYEAHRFAGTVFGVESPLHLKGDLHRKTESINSGVFEEEANIRIIKPRIRTFKEAATRSKIKDNSKEKEKLKKETIENAKKEKELIDSYIVDGRLEFANLQMVNSFVGDVFLNWVSKAFENKSLMAKTEDGRTFHLIKPANGEICIVSSEDGSLLMPAYILVFGENDEITRDIA